MGCVGSSSKESPFVQKTHDVCITSVSPVLSSEDFAAFFAVWILKICGELNLTVAPFGRTSLGSAEHKPNSREMQTIRKAVLASRILVCIMNIAPGGQFPPPGYMAEITWAHDCRIPVVPFVDADKHNWKEVSMWHAEIPAVFRSGLGPVRYHRATHEQAKTQLSVALRLGLANVDVAEEHTDGAAAEAAEGEVAGLSKAAARRQLQLELSGKERQLLGFGAASGGEEQKRRRREPEDDGLAEEKLGFDRSDFERAGLVERRLERTNSLQDVNVETALAMLAQRARGPGIKAADPLAPRDGGCRLKFLEGCDVSDQYAQGSEPAHKILAPARGILKKAGQRKEKTPAFGTSKPARHLRLAAGDAEGADRRFRFAMQQLEKHLDGLTVDDVHELTTVISVLKDGLKEDRLVVRALPLLKAFLDTHRSLHSRAIRQGVIPAIVSTMKEHCDSVELIVHAYGVIVPILEEATSNNAEAEQVVDAGGATITHSIGVSSDAAVQGEFSALMDCPSLISKAGGLEAITGGMKKYAACEALQERGCQCLGLLARGAPGNRVSDDYKRGKKVESAVMLRGQARRLISRHGGVPLLLEAMRRYIANAELQAAACMAMGQLGSSEVKVKKRAAEGGVIGLVLRALAKHQQHPRVQQYACTALRQLASNAQKNKDYIAERGGVQRLCEAGRRFIRTPHRVVTVEALGALCHLASKHPENKQRIFDADALELVMDALDAERQTGAEVDVGMAMSGLGLLHNLSCDDGIKRHVVKLGGRETAERLEKHSAGAVRSLARVLGRTLLPPAEVVADPFGSLFATRMPGSSAPAHRVASKRGKKNAKAAILAVSGEVDGIEYTPDLAEKEPPRKPKQRKSHAPRIRRGDQSSAGGHDANEDARSEGGDSDASASSAASTSSTYSTGAARKPGQTRKGPKRFGNVWNEDGGVTTTSGKSDWAALGTLRDAADVAHEIGAAKTQPDDDAQSVASSNASNASSYCSQLSLEANEALAKGDLAGALRELNGPCRVRGAEEEDPRERRKKLKQRRSVLSAEAGTPQRPSLPAAGPKLETQSTVSSHSASSRGSSQASRTGPKDRLNTAGNVAASIPERAPSSTFVGRVVRAVSDLEQKATKNLDRAGNTMRGARV